MQRKFFAILMFSLGIWTGSVFAVYAAFSSSSENPNTVHFGSIESFHLFGAYVRDEIAETVRDVSYLVTWRSHLAAAEAETPTGGNSFWCWLRGLVGFDCTHNVSNSLTKTPTPAPRMMQKSPAVNVLSDTPELSIPDSVTLKNPPPQNKILSFESIVASLKTVFAPISALGTLEYRIGALERNTGGKNVSDPEARNDILALKNRVDAVVSNNPIILPGALTSSSGFRNDIFSGIISGATISNSSFSGTGGSFTGDLSVGGGLTVGGASSLSGALTAGGTLYVDAVNGRVGVGSSTPTDVFSLNGPLFMASVAPAQTASRLYNNAGGLYWAGSLIGGASVGNWTTDGTHVWRASGNVGIGTTTPGQKLVVNGVINSLDEVLFDSGTVGKFTWSGAPNNYMSVRGGVGYGLSLGTNNTDSRMFITSGGNVGIGTTTPSQMLDVYGTVKALKVNAGLPDAYAFGGGDFNLATKNGLQVFQGASSDDIRIRMVNNDNTIQLAYWNWDNINSASVFGVKSTSYLKFANSLVNNGTNAGFQFNNVADALATDQVLSVSDGGGQLFTIMGNGNVGIGTTSPANPLHVVGSNPFRLDSSTDGASLLILRGTGAITQQNIAAQFEDTASVAKSFAQIRFLPTDRTAGSEDADLAFFLRNAGSLNEAVRITGTGNVGIGTTSPGSLLSVAGNGYFTGTLKANDGLTQILNESGFGTFRTTSSMRLATNANGLELNPASFGIQFMVGSTEYMRLNSSGNFGIGTTSPYAKLTVWGQGTGTGTAFEIANNASTTLARFLDNGTGYFLGNIGIGTTSPYAKFAVADGTGTLAFQNVNQNNLYVSGVNASVIVDSIASSYPSFVVKKQGVIMGSVSSSDITGIQLLNASGSGITVLDTSGFVGVGTTSPLSRLAISGGASIGANYNIAAPTNGLIVEGNVGVGTNAPTARLQIGETVNTLNQLVFGKYETAAEGNLPLIQQKSVLSVGAGNDLALGAQSSSGGILFYTGNSAVGNVLGSGSNAIRMAIHSAGNVGIGTTSPATDLHIFAPADANIGNIKIQSSDADNSGISFFGRIAPNAASRNWMVAKDYNGFGNFEILRSTTGTGNPTTATLAIDSTGNVGIGTTTPLSKLTVSGGQSIGANYNIAAPTNGLIVEGNVGIATSSPWRTLSVSGTVAMNGLTASATGNALCITTGKEITDAGGASCVPSSARFKENVETLASGFALDELQKLSVVSFDYKDGAYSPEDLKGSYGMIAEDVEKIDPKLVDYGYDGKPFTLKFEKFIGLLVQAIQELLARVTGLEEKKDTQATEIEALKMQMNTQATEIEALKMQMNAIGAQTPLPLAPTTPPMVSTPSTPTPPPSESAPADAPNVQPSEPAAEQAPIIEPAVVP